MKSVIHLLPRAASLRLKQHLHEYKFEKLELSEDEREFIKITRDAGIGFAGSVAASAIFQPLMTLALNLSVTRAVGLSYQEGVKNIREMPLPYHAKQSKNMFQHRLLFSLIPAAVAWSVSETFDLTPSALVATHVALKNGLVSSVKRDHNIRFHAVNAKRYKLLDANGNNLNLLQLKEEEFYEAARNSADPKVHQFDEKDWEKLQKRIRVSQENLPHQAFALLLRNSVTSAAAFAARPIAQNLEQGLAISKMTGMSKEDSELALTNATRLTFAWFSTCFDRAFTLLAAGNKNTEQVYKKLTLELCEGNFGRQLFAGGLARTLFCFLAATSITEGPRLAKQLSEKIPGLEEDFKKLEKSNSPNSSVSAAKVSRDFASTLSNSTRSNS
ncbi:MAG: hypothetical protein FJX34_06010 [Alphaproteobacteria bacterium]|nr:hypothetical protein [Alphaproteobacteria bacterium]